MYNEKEILEALHYLHAICKLIHRNLNPRNILVAVDDNWKLAGLEFALRFESATINQADSVMAQESAALLRYPPASANSRAALRRQATLHQSKCDEFIRHSKGRLQQPEVDYLAPEMWRSAKCSHKSDMFSYGLILGQTYDLLRHKPPISCRSRAANYETELKRLQERRKKKLSRSVPLEMREPLLEMLDSEPTMRPSANYALQLFRRPIELCAENEDSLRHLKSSLCYLNSRCSSGCTAAVCSHSSSNNNNNTGSSNNKNDKKRISYFRKVTSSAAADRTPSSHRRLTRNLNLLNLLVRGVDSLATQCTSSLALEAATSNDSINNQQPQQQQQQQPSYLAFALLKQQFEFTLESLRQVYSSGMGSETFTLPDSRNLLLSVALHRRLLDQLAQMRAELPQVSRLAGVALQTNRVGQNHRSLEESGDKLQSLVSKHSLPRLSLVLADPLLKLDEFLLVYELVNDLLVFVGQKCRQNFSLRGKQLLNDLTPLTGCPSLSSSEEEDDSVGSGIRTSALVSAGRQQHYASEISTKMSNQNHHQQQQLNRMSGHRFSEYEDPARRQQQQQYDSNNNVGGRYLANYPTKISITAPSPMGSVRDVHGISDDSPPDTRGNEQATRIRHSADDQYMQMVERTSQLNLANNYKEGSVSSGSGNDSNGNYIEDDDDGEQEQSGAEERGGSKSRSQLIDELLRTINDDSFNDLVGFNDKATSNAAQTGGRSDQISATQLANLNRPRSAMAASSSGQNVASGGQQSKVYSSQQRGSTSSNSQRPNSLALNSNQQRQQIRPPGATFDNVIRRMSTNIVQNFNKMSNSLADQQDGGAGNKASTAVRKEKSSNPTNNLYVDNQVPIRRHSDNTINVPRIQVALSSPQSTSRLGLNQRASISASKLANKWKLSAKTSRRESSDKLSPNLSGALGYIRRHSSGNAAGNEQNQSNGQASSSLFSASPFKTKSSSNLGLDFLISNRSMKRRCSAASMIGHQTQRKAEDLLDAGMKSVSGLPSRLPIEM